jgi:hypothetical protein
MSCDWREEMLFLAFFSSGCNQSNLSTILAAKLVKNLNGEKMGVIF